MRQKRGDRRGVGIEPTANASAECPARCYNADRATAEYPELLKHRLSPFRRAVVALLCFF
jgi:hypothetical protein